MTLGKRQFIDGECDMRREPVKLIPVPKATPMTPAERERALNENYGSVAFLLETIGNVLRVYSLKRTETPSFEGVRELMERLKKK
jgi:hypothetical protein